MFAPPVRSAEQTHRRSSESAPASAAPDRRRDSRRLLLLVSVNISLLAASSAPTPLYAIYALEWGFTPITTTVVFGVYAIAVLAALLVFGRLSDHTGRRPVLIAGLTMQVLTMLVF